jgi:Zn-dependent metalloprotease
MGIVHIKRGLKNKALYLCVEHISVRSLVEFYYEVSNLVSIYVLCPTCFLWIVDNLVYMNYAYVFSYGLW